MYNPATDSFLKT